MYIYLFLICILIKISFQQYATPTNAQHCLHSMGNLQLLTLPIDVSPAILTPPRVFYILVDVKIHYDGDDGQKNVQSAFAGGFYKLVSEKCTDGLQLSFGGKTGVLYYHIEIYLGDKQILFDEISGSFRYQTNNEYHKVPSYKGFVIFYIRLLKTDLPILHQYEQINIRDSKDIVWRKSGEDCLMVAGYEKPFTLEVAPLPVSATHPPTIGVRLCSYDTEKVNLCASFPAWWTECNAITQMDPVFIVESPSSNKNVVLSPILLGDNPIDNPNRDYLVDSSNNVLQITNKIITDNKNLETAERKTKVYLVKANYQYTSSGGVSQVVKRVDEEGKLLPPRIMETEKVYDADNMKFLQWSFI